MNAIKLPAREVPFPSSISAEARESLIAMEQNKEWVRFGYPDPKDKEAWRAFVAQVNAGMLQSAALYRDAGRPGIRSETATMNGVRVYISTPDDMPASAQCRPRCAASSTRTGASDSVTR